MTQTVNPRPVAADRSIPGSRQTRFRPGRWLYLAPAGVLLAALSIYPLAQLVRMAVSSVSLRNLNSAWPFVGVQNFVDGVSSGDTQRGLTNTLLFVVIVTVIGVVAGSAAAIALRGASRVSAALLALMVFIWALPPVVNGSVWKFLFADSGLFNTAAHALGLPAIPFLYDQHIALVSVAFVNAWAVIPFNTLVFRASILNIPVELFEAAQLDGARPWQQIRFVIFPALRPTTIVLLVLTIVYAFRSFDFVYVMTQGGPGNATQTLPYLSYLQAFVQFDFGRGSATAIVAVLLVIVLAVVYARTVVKEESA